MKSLKQYFYLIVSVFAFSCAQIVPLNGGKQDVDGPRTIKSVPENKSVNYNSTSVQIWFDEYIVVKDAAGQFQINPLMDEIPEISNSNKSIAFQWKEKLKPETTYRLEWGNAVGDLHEGNVSVEKELIFSTGNQIDTFNITGKVSSDEKINYRDIRVNLYLTEKDSLPYLKKPEYSVHTDDKGNYKVPYLKNRKYFIVAIEDKNKNYLYEQGEEKIGWSLDGSEIKIFSEKPYKAFIKKENNQSMFMKEWIFNREMDSVCILNRKGDTIYRSQQALDTLKIWRAKGTTKADTLLLFEKNKLVDTLEIPELSDEKIADEIKRRKVQPELVKKMNLFPAKNSIQLAFNQPVKIADITKIKLMDSTGANIPYDIKKQMEKGQFIYGSDSLYNIIELSTALQYSKSYIVCITPGALQSCSEEKNDSLKYTFTNSPAESYGTLIIQLKLDEKKQYLFDLMDAKDQIIYHEVISNANKKQINVAGLLPGEYKMRVTKDINSDKRYSNGDFLKKIIPEERIYFNTTLKAIADWEIEQEWNLMEEKMN